MAEWFKAAVLKTVERKFRGFESYSLRQPLQGRQMAGKAPELNGQTFLSYASQL